ncbi:GNAT family N-acetyltransferase [Chryseobacterium sp. Ch-15]|uniref:GNAT family N-acetyltransferase n=1 Tax=Chryseobacterium muglaense TaxID=2893752 RepID=A0A9Q3UV70_9FLAO|nr:GNAT family N-acetyltransferase [Chryseobacterium muglaense]MBD3904858.1 GNAT family N-acetyltransferase [Chryseobacterium muglaense]MCC9034406.1 GNAT family N-acetyltransferase [Chryseobacterium muglaense]MCM2554513.1 GNAT family N-acetyltransferase [Chryseobacterium muglaense]
MVELNFFKPKDLSELNYKLDEIQAQFSALPKQALERIEARNQNDDFFAYPITIFYDEKAAGFCVLDFGNDKLELTDNQDSVLLRSLSVNPEFQGNGIGKSVMIVLDDFIKEHFNDCNEIVLSVNERNDLAFQIYAKKGYVYAGKKIDGRSGPQFVMSKNLD